MTNDELLLRHARLYPPEVRKLGELLTKDQRANLVAARQWSAIGEPGFC